MTNEEEILRAQLEWQLADHRYYRDLYSNIAAQSGAGNVDRLAMHNRMIGEIEAKLEQLK